MPPIDSESTDTQTFPVGYSQKRTISSHASITMGDCLLKAEDWAYEKEWRAFRNLVQKQQDSTLMRNGDEPFHTGQIDQFGNPVVLFDIPADAVREIIVGLHTSQEHRVVVAQTLLSRRELKHVKLFTISCDPSTFELRKTAISPEYLASEGGPKLRRAAADPTERERLFADIRESLAHLTKDELQFLGDQSATGELRIKAPYENREIEDFVIQVIKERLHLFGLMAKFELRRKALPSPAKMPLLPQ